MTTQKALELLDQAVASVNTNREGHKALEEAMMTLGNELGLAHPPLKPCSTPKAE